MEDQEVLIIHVDVVKAGQTVVNGVVVDHVVGQETEINIKTNEMNEIVIDRDLDQDLMREQMKLTITIIQI